MHKKWVKMEILYITGIFNSLNSLKSSQSVCLYKNFLGVDTTYVFLKREGFISFLLIYVSVRTVTFMDPWVFLLS